MELKPILMAAGMLLAGSINTIAIKAQDLVIVGTAPDGSSLTYNHPVMQSAFMFVGEFLCLLLHFVREWSRQREGSGYLRQRRVEGKPRAWRIRRLCVFAIPTCCDAIATTLLNLGLYYTYPSVYQMLRGTLVLFAGFFTVIILRRSLFIHHYLGMVLITCGAAIVGAASIVEAEEAAARGGGSGGGIGLSPEHGSGLMWLHGLARGLRDIGTRPLDVLQGAPDVNPAAAPLFGNLMIVAAQGFAALQFILEEKFVVKYKVPTLLAVGLEGMWGILLALLVLPLTSLIKKPDGTVLDDAVQALRDIAAHPPLLHAVLLSVFAISLFNYCGISVTKLLSGAARASIDACRTIIVWTFSVYVGWEVFVAPGAYLQLVGFLVLIAGTALYNELLRSCLPLPDMPPDDSEEDEESEEEWVAAEEGGPSVALLSGVSEDGLYEDCMEEGSMSSLSPALPSFKLPPTPHPSLASQNQPSFLSLLAKSFTLRQPPQSGMSANGLGRGSMRNARSSPNAVPVPNSRIGRHDSEEYTMARSVRVGMHTLDPRSLDADSGMGSAPRGSAYLGSNDNSIHRTDSRLAAGKSATSLLEDDETVEDYDASGSLAGDSSVTLSNSMPVGQPFQPLPQRSEAYAVAIGQARRSETSSGRVRWQG